MRYYAMDAAAAKRFLQMRSEGREPALDEFVVEKGVGEPYPQERVKDLRAQLLNLKSRYPQELKQRDVEGGRFEAQACEIVHRHLDFDAEAMADPGFWTWLAVTQLSEVVEWRHGGAGHPAALINYGIGNRVENLIFRMWLRAEIACDKGAKDPYLLAKRGDQDLWRSHILRQSYGNVRPLARELIRFQCPRQGKTTLDTQGIRALAKHLRRLHANLLFECLEPKQLADLISEQARSVALTNGRRGIARRLLRRGD